MPSYRFRLEIVQPVEHSMEMVIVAPSDAEALSLAHKSWRDAPVWEHRSTADLRNGETGETIWRQSQDVPR